jgi:steroid delta-isomerase-like uncharacterized protein
VSRSLSSKVEAANSTLIGNGDLDAVAEFFTSDYVAHVTEGHITGGHGAIRKVLRMYRRAFRDIRVEVEVFLEKKDRVAWQRTLRATHTGAFKGFPATGRRIVWRDMVVSRFREGLIAEDWFLRSASCLRGSGEPCRFSSPSAAAAEVQRGDSPGRVMQCGA